MCLNKIPKTAKTKLNYILCKMIFNEALSIQWMKALFPGEYFYIYLKTLLSFVTFPSFLCIRLTRLLQKFFVDLVINLFHLCITSFFFRIICKQILSPTFAPSFGCPFFYFFWVIDSVCKPDFRYVR